MNFDQALILLKNGKRIQLRTWVFLNVYIVLAGTDSLDELRIRRDIKRKTLKNIYQEDDFIVISIKGELYPWKRLQADIDADDWRKRGAVH